MDEYSEKGKFVEDFKNRTKSFAVRCIFLFRKLPKTTDAQLIGKQFFRSATSVAANYRAACIARSKAEFYAKISVTLEEADECLFWLDILTETEVIPEEKLNSLKQETREIIFVLSKARKNTQK